MAKASPLLRLLAENTFIPAVAIMVASAMANSFPVAQAMMGLPEPQLFEPVLQVRLHIRQSHPFSVMASPAKPVFCSNQLQLASIQR